jgi:hypothetical protein
VVLVMVVSIIHSNNTYFTSIPLHSYLAVTFLLLVTKGNKSFKIPSTSLSITFEDQRKHDSLRLYLGRFELQVINNFT